MDKKDLKDIPANYYEPDYQGPGCAFVLILIVSLLPFIALMLWALSYLIS